MDHTTHRVSQRPLSAGDHRALQALAEPNRIRIIELLGGGEHCVCDVGEALSLSSALVSHHLRVLREAGLLAERRVGRWVHYSLDVARVAGLREAIDALLTPTDAAKRPCTSSVCGSQSRRTSSPAGGALAEGPRA